jgi:serralysin
VPDIAGDSSTTSTIAVGSVVTGSIEVVSDHDWFRIDLIAGQSISIVLNGTGTMPLGDPYLRIRDAAGNLLAQNDDGGPGLNSLLNFTASATGTYYIDVSEYDSGVGDYQLQVNPFTPPPVGSVNQFASQLASGYWDGNSHHFNVTQGGNLSVNLTGLTTTGQNLARLALRQWGDVIGISFVEVSSGGQILFDDDQTGASSSSTYSNGIISQSRVNVSVQWLTDYGTSVNSYGFQTYVHEIGHALGLGHAGNYNSEATYATDALYANDGWPMSIMSYFSPNESSFYASQGFTRSYVTTPMIADIAAIGMLYGLSTTTRAGATTYGFNSNAGDVFNASLNPSVAYTVFDSGGIDTLDFSGFSQDQTIDLGQGQFSNVGGRVGTVAIAVGTVIENAVGGGGNDTVRGNEAANVLSGGNGNDSIFGFGGEDIFAAEGGDDLLNGGAGVDTVSYANAAAAISVNGNVVTSQGNAGGFGTDTLAEVETILGSAFNDVFIGTELAQRFEGNAGNDSLSGLGGADVFVGGAGADTFHDSLAAHNGDTIIDFSGGDRIVFADANLNSFAFSLTGSTLNYSGGSMTLNNFTGRLAAKAGPGGIGVQLTISRTQFDSPELTYSNFGSNPGAGGWTSNEAFPRMLADINGDRLVDIVGFGAAGVYVALGAAGGFAPMTLASSFFGANSTAGGWTSNDRYPRLLGDVNGDGRADVVGFGNNGVYVALGGANGTFGVPTLATTAFGAAAEAGGWSSNNLYLRQLADVNGDGRSDIIGFGNAGTYVSLARADGSFGATALAATSFGVAANAGGWASNDSFPRRVVDVNGDGRADIVGFGSSGVYVSLANADGTFAGPLLGLREFGSSAGGWTSENQFPRDLADVNGDGRIDIVGFGNSGVYVALGLGNGMFGAGVLELGAFGASAAAGGWSSENGYPRVLADINGDGAADIVGFGSSGVIAALSTGDILT